MNETKTSPNDSGAGDDEPPMTALEEAVDILRTVAIAVAITLFVRFFFFQPFNIPSGSMKPTLQIGDFILVDKVEYGYSRASLLWPATRAPMRGRLFEDTPQQGEVVVFKNACDRNRDYIKRVIGMPGDTVEIASGAIYINSVRVQRERMLDMPSHCAFREGIVTDAPIYRETLPSGQSYLIQECYGDNFTNDDAGPFTVPAEHYFVMGDNRDNSSDSRTLHVGYREMGLGSSELRQCAGSTHAPHFVPLDQMVGKATRVAFSVDGDRAKIWEPWKWPTAIRYGRLMDRVE